MMMCFDFLGVSLLVLGMFSRPLFCLLFALFLEVFFTFFNKKFAIKKNNFNYLVTKALT